jgi:type I restriction enzyme S subunit
MSKLDELIAEFCPDGVEYVQLEEICELTWESNVSKNDI